MVDDKKNIPDAGKAGESPKPEKAEPVKADSPVHDQPAPAKAGAPVIEDASKVVTPSTAEKTDSTQKFGMLLKRIPTASLLSSLHTQAPTEKKTTPEHSPLR